MPSDSAFDYYAELEVGSSVSQQELTASYRRLARVHHPDKNPDNLQEATASFQRIQFAYETLSDPEQRARYDARRFSPPSAVPRQGASYQDAETYMADILHEYLFNMYFSGFSSFFASSGGPGYGRTQQEWEERQRRFNERQRANFEQRAEAQAFAEEQRFKAEAAQAARRKARANAKAAQEEVEAEERCQRQKKEQENQEARWENISAASKDEKVAACLHSGFCAKIPQHKKFKCATCNVKRGMIAFECPYCAQLLCSLCIVNFAKKRTMAEKQPSVKTEPTPGADTESTADLETETENNKQNRERTEDTNPKNGKNGKGSGPDAKKGKACYNCGEIRHLAKQCTGPKRSGQRRNKNRKGNTPPTGQSQKGRETQHNGKK
ncbi:hypothetical protein F4779DRAFT_618360 [Xylariaceae sp. FL0662B]|nr:hypothetical protein F4779DRAFT_618360 [Xylariaceae sp. FL0662B]